MHVYVCVYLSPPPSQLPVCVTRKHNARSRQGMAAGRLTPGGGSGAAEDGEQLDGAGLSSGHPSDEIPGLWPAVALATRCSALCNGSRDIAVKGGRRSGGEELPTEPPHKAKGAGAELDAPRGINPDARQKRLHCHRVGWARLGAPWCGAGPAAGAGARRGAAARLPPRRAAPSTARPPPRPEGAAPGKGAQREPAGRGAAGPRRGGVLGSLGSPTFCKEAGGKRAPLKKKK